MLSWLLTVALAGASPAAQTINSPQAPAVSSIVRPPDANGPFARLFGPTAEDAKGDALRPVLRAESPRRPLHKTRGFATEDESVEVICGLTVVKKSAEIDPGIALPANRGAGIAVRRIEPDVCGVTQRVSPK
jgi:hypothetical protein